MARFVLLLVWLAQLACQDYTFEYLPLLRLGVAKRVQVVANFRPTDILFVIDDSGTMGEERSKLIASLERFITPLASSGMDFHLGIVTTDVDCLVPDRCCPEDPDSNCTPDRQSSASCCRLTGSLGLGRGCSDQLNLSTPHTTCNGGRLRAPQGKRFFTNPSIDPNTSKAKWIEEVTQTISSLGLCGSSYESGLEAMARAVQCGKASLDANGLWNGQNPNDCADSALARLNAGFIRPDADLVVVFLSDEDDCSFQDRSKYFRPADPADANSQANHLCEPEECYASYACLEFSEQNSCSNASGCSWDSGTQRCQVDRTSPQLSNWILGDPAAFFRCDGQQRLANPPYPDEVKTYVDLLSKIKPNIKQIRVAGVLGGRVLTESSPNYPLAFQAIGCAGGVGGLTAQCGCLNTNQDLSQLDAKLACEVTKVTGGLFTPTPSVSQATTNSCFGPIIVGSGCQAMPATRYVQFLQQIRQARLADGISPDTLADSICNNSYESTIEKVVNTLILTRCFDFDPPLPEKPEVMVRKINAAGVITMLERVDPQSSTPGFSIARNRKEICLEGGESKQLGDTFEILLREDGTLPN